MVREMFIKENIMLAIAGLKSNKMRALLTMLGIIIGIASVIGVVSVGNAMTASVTSSLSSMGATNITVNVQEKSAASIAKATAQNNANGKNSSSGSQNNTGGKNPTSSSSNASKGAQTGGGSAPSTKGVLGGGGKLPSTGRSSSKSSSTTKDTDLMTMDQINTLQEEFSDKISTISINESSVSGKVKNDITYANINTIGTNVGYQDVKNIQIKDGRYLAQKDIDEVKNVAVVSDKLVARIFGDNVDPIDKEIKVYTFKGYFHIYYSWSVHL